MSDDPTPVALRVERIDPDTFRVTLEAPDGGFVFTADPAALTEIRDTLSRALGDGVHRNKRMT